MNIREPAVADIFYPQNPHELSTMIENYLNNVDISIKNKQIKWIVSPHAGYIYSGPIAAYAYDVIKENWNNIPKTFVILAPSHHEYMEFASCGIFDEYKTPLGNIKVDLKLGNQLINDYADWFSFLPKAHEKEHSVEVQLPFLQYVSKWNDFEILPILVGNINPIEIGNILYKISKTKDIFFIVSSDLSHYSSYEDASSIDQNTLRWFLSQNIKTIAETADACGIYPWLVLNQVSILSNWHPKLLKYANSGDTAWWKEQVVGYASLVYLSNN